MHGLENFVGDLVRNGGLPAQVDTRQFAVGRNLATTPGAVVYRDSVMELIQYRPVGDEVHRRPLLIAPPQINKFYVFDLVPEKSIVQLALKGHLQTFAISWKNPTAAESHFGLDTYVAAMEQAVDVMRDITGSADVNIWGSCSGGITMSAFLANLAARGEPKVHSATVAVCVLDMAVAQNTTAGMFVTPESIIAAKSASQLAGVVEGQELARMFAWMRPNDLIWNYWVNNYLLGNAPPAFDVLYWNNDTTRLPARLHADFLDLIGANPYVNAGRLDGARHAARHAPGEHGQLCRGRRDRSHHAVARMLQHGQALRRAQHLRARQQRPYPEPAQSAGKSQGILLGRRDARGRTGRVAGTGDEARRKLVAALARVDQGTLGRDDAGAGRAWQRAEPAARRRARPIRDGEIGADQPARRRRAGAARRHSRAARAGPPLLIFNGIGASIELVEPFLDALDGREAIIFDVPGVGGSPAPRLPYRPGTLARLSARLLDQLGHARVDALGVSWGGALAQQFAFQEAKRCRRLVLAATSPGHLMVPGRLTVLLKMATPRRYKDPST